MKNVILILIAITTFSLLPAMNSEAKKRPRRSGGSCPKTECNGCEKPELQTMIRSDPKWSAAFDEMTGQGIWPISCLRTEACQQKLRDGCPGRAAKGKSNHQEPNIAMDLSSHKNPDKAKQIVAKHVGNFRSLSHRGGGEHISNGQGEGSAYRGLGESASKYRRRRQGN